MKNTVESSQEPARRKGVSLSAVGVILTLLFGASGIYFYLHVRRPHLSFEVVSESNVLDVNMPMKELAISFQGQDIQAKNLNLRIYTLRITNDGEVDILKDMFDDQQEWGLCVSDGTVIDCKLVDGSSAYLKRALANPSIVPKRWVRLNKCIMERGKSATYQILVLHDRTQPPSIEAFGKIAGIDALGPIMHSPESDQGALSARVFGGDFVVQLSRILAYGLVLGLALATLYLAVRAISNTHFDRMWQAERAARTARIADVATESPDVVKNPLWADFALRYAEGGESFLRWLDPHEPDFLLPAFARWAGDPPLLQYAILDPDGKAELTPEAEALTALFKPKAMRIGDNASTG